MRVELVRYGKTKKWLLIGGKKKFDLFNTRQQAMVYKELRDKELNKKKFFERG